MATAFERSGVFPGSVVVGMQPRTGVGELWANHSAFYSVMTQLETNIGTMEATDIENYAYWRHAVATAIPILAPAPEIFLPATGGGGTIWVDAWPGYKHTVQENDNLGQTTGWRDVQTFICSSPDRVERFAVKPARGRMDRQRTVALSRLIGDGQGLAGLHAFLERRAADRMSNGFAERLVLVHKPLDKHGFQHRNRGARNLHVKAICSVLKMDLHGSNRIQVGRGAQEEQAKRVCAAFFPQFSGRATAIAEDRHAGLPAPGRCLSPSRPQ